jgi:two-component system NtrC family sensor kinase
VYLGGKQKKMKLRAKASLLLLITAIGLIVAFHFLVDYLLNVSLKNLANENLSPDAINQVKQLSLWFQACLAIAIMIFVLFNAGFLERAIVKRLRRLNGYVFEITRNGSFASKVPVEGNDEISYLSWAINDMLARLYESQSSLRDSKQKYSTLVENSTDGILLIDDNTITYANPKFKTMFGRPLDTAIGCRFRDLIGSEYRDEADRNRAARLAWKPTPNTYEITLLHADGREIPVEISPKIIEMGGRQCDMVVVRDITERKLAEAELKRQKDIIDRIIASTPDCVAVLNSDQRLVLANSAFRQTFCPGAAQVEDIPLIEIIPDQELAEKTALVLGGDNSHLQCEFRHRLKDQDVILAANVINMQKEVLIILRDISEERERRERLYLTDRLASVGEMASGIAHELNNPLTTIVGLSQLLAEEDLPESVKEDLRAVFSEAQRAASIVNNLLTFARKHPPERRQIQINSILEDVLRLRAYVHKTSNIQVHSRLDDHLPATLADYFQIQQVFLNIILNAESAMIEAHQRGILNISTEAQDGQLKISFADDGPGIPEENLSRIFNPFFTTKPVGKGTGLGLSISYGIISSHNGKIYVNSQRGRGATFVVELPVMQSQV